MGVRSQAGQGDSVSLPTQREMILNAIAALDKARSSLSDARDWLHSDWQPIDSPLSTAAADARASTLRAVGSMKHDIDAAKRSLHEALEQLSDAVR